MTLVRGGKPIAGSGLANDNPGAGEGDGFGLARFGEGGELVREVAVKIGDPQFTLIWDTDADLDLHVIEPGGKEIYWEEPKGKQGGELDVDNTKGFGPENIYWLVESDGVGSKKVKGPGPLGVYQWFIVYWGGFGGVPKLIRFPAISCTLEIYGELQTVLIVSMSSRTAHRLLTASSCNAS